MQVVTCHKRLTMKQITSLHDMSLSDHNNNLRTLFHGRCVNNPTEIIASATK